MFITVFVTVRHDTVDGKIQIAKVLVEHGAIVRRCALQEKSALDVAVESIISQERDAHNIQRMIDLLKFLVQNGGDPNDCKEKEESLLMSALRARCAEVAEVLINAGANVNHIGILNETPLKCCIGEGNSTFVITLNEMLSDKVLSSIPFRSFYYNNVFKCIDNRLNTLYMGRLKE